MIGLAGISGFLYTDSHGFHSACVARIAVLVAHTNLDSDSTAGSLPVAPLAAG